MFYKNLHTKYVRLFTVLIAIIVAISMMIVHTTPASAATVESIIVASPKPATISVVNPSSKVQFQIGSLNSSPNTTYTVTLQDVDGLISSDSAYSNSTNVHTEDGDSASGTIDLFANYSRKTIPSGTYTFRLKAKKYASNDGEIFVSKSFKVTVKKLTTKISVTPLIEKVKFYKNDKDLGYQVYQYFSTENARTGKVELQRQENGKWKYLASTSISKISSSDTGKFLINQKTPAATKYRFYTAGDASSSGATSAVFTIKGAKQDAKFATKYSSSSQKYKKTAVKLTFSVASGVTGKA
ncbi:MAG: hypothetical protein LBN22_03600, partial [Clostridiales Family XIII bacterium]|nr:hypothetical protein [Clostridiales Family XIII bacterium]